MLFIFLQTLAKPLLCAERTGGLVMNSAAMRISTLTALLVAVSASDGRCEIPGYPSPPGGVENLGFSWCPASGNFQVRAFALPAASIQCSVAAVPNPPPEAVSRARSQIHEVCGRLGAPNGIPCRCPPGYGP